MKPLTKGQLLRLEAKVVANAGELLEEARILLNARHVARAFALAHLASEELAKAMLVGSVRKSLTDGEVPNWREFATRFRSHPTKIGQFVSIRYLVPFNGPEAGLPQVIMQALSNVGNPLSGNRGDMANDCGAYVQVWNAPSAD